MSVWAYELYGGTADLSQTSPDEYTPDDYLLLHDVSTLDWHHLWRGTGAEFQVGHHISGPAPPFDRYVTASHVRDRRGSSSTAPRRGDLRQEY